MDDATRDYFTFNLNNSMFYLVKRTPIGILLAAFLATPSLLSVAPKAAIASAEGCTYASGLVAALLGSVDYVCTNVIGSGDHVFMIESIRGQASHDITDLSDDFIINPHATYFYITSDNKTVTLGTLSGPNAFVRDYLNFTVNKNIPDHSHDR